MGGKAKWTLVLGTWILILACNTGGLVDATATSLNNKQTTGAPPGSVNSTATQPAQTQPANISQATQTPPPTLQLCSLINAQEASDLLESGVQAPQEVDQACVYKSLPEGRNSVSVSAAQGLDTQNILDNQILMLENAGVNLDQHELEYLQSLEVNQDFSAFFEELVADANGAGSVRARLVTDNANGYWAWFTSSNQDQGALVLVRGDTLVEVDLVVYEGSDENATLEAARTQADLVFQRLPANFVLPATIE
jgi:hypothetical protein